MKSQIVAILAIAVLVALSVLYFGCKSDTTSPGGGSNITPADTLGAQLNAQQGYEKLEDQFTFWFNNKRTFNNAAAYDRLDFLSAKTLYRQALLKDPGNLDANLGAAITELMTAYSDTALNGAIKRWEEYGHNRLLSDVAMAGGIPLATGGLPAPAIPAAANILALYQGALNDPPLVNEMQTMVRERLLPRIDYALARLAVIESNPGCRFRISGKMQGDETLVPVYLYITEIQLTEAALHAAKVAIDEVLMYQFPLTNYSRHSLVQALQQNNTTFFVLASDGAQRGLEAKASFQTMLDKIKAATQNLQRTGQYSDAALKIGNKGIKQADLDTITVYLDKARQAMNGPLTVHLSRADHDKRDYDIQVYLGKLFDNPPHNPKADFLPAYTLDSIGSKDYQMKFTANTYDDFNFPDPTFGGVFPGMTNETAKRLLRVDESYAYRLYGDIYYEGGYWWDVTQPAYTVTLVTANNTTYTTTAQGGYYYAYFEFPLFVHTDNSTYRLYVNSGAGNIEVARQSPAMTLTPKTRDWVNIVIPRAPDQITCTRASNSISLSFYLSGSTVDGEYVIQRGIGSSSIPVDYDSTCSTMSSYYDSHVTAGQSYRYRVRTKPINCDYYYYYYSMFRPKNAFLSPIVDVP